MVVIYRPKNGIGINFPHEMNTFLAGEWSECSRGTSGASKKIAVFKVQMGFLATFQNKATGFNGHNVLT